MFSICHHAGIDSEIAAISEMGAKVSGTVRITAIDHVVDSVVWPRLHACCTNRHHAPLALKLVVDALRCVPARTLQPCGPGA